ncbi:hypothetical protein CBM2598_U30108 [Cupriavidus taiwanensis]|nr:hypothetical protein CBM2598_U30108 [Cupriavidus taiwanensis]
MTTALPRRFIEARQPLNKMPSDRWAFFLSAWNGESAPLAGLDAVVNNQERFQHAPADEDCEHKAVDAVSGGQVFEHGLVPTCCCRQDKVAIESAPVKLRSAREFY